MNHAAFHLAEEFISEDLDYYFSGERDKNNHIRPDKNIYSMTPTSSHLSHELNDGHVANFLFPFMPNLLDRIYIGPSVPLFANNWGASFLLQLLKVLKPGGTIILPVYPEAQAHEKGYWSRSFLENVFLSRQRWSGFSNVSAENDGVMSLQVGRKWPDRIPSTIEWFYQQRSNLVLQEMITANTEKDIPAIYSRMAEKVWNNYTYSAVIEKVISDRFGSKTPVVIQNISNDYGLLLTELLLSPYINVVSGVTSNVSTTNENIASNFINYFNPLADKSHHIETSDNTDITFCQEPNVISVINVLSSLDKSTRKTLLNRIWQHLTPGGLLIIYDDQINNDHVLDALYLNDLPSFNGDILLYSSIVASKIQQTTDISHYSSIQESRLESEKLNKHNIFRVLQKSR